MHMKPVQLMRQSLEISDNLTIEGALKAARDYERKLVVDMICVEDLPNRIAKMEEIGVDILAVHTGADQQAAGREPIQDLQVMTEHAKRAQIAVAGGINSKTIDKYVALKPEIIIVGSAIGHADDPVAEAKAIKDAML